MKQPANDTLLKQSAALNQLFDLKTFSWTLAIEDLEQVLPSGVQVNSLEPVRDAKTGIIALKLRVVGPRDRSVDLVENLEHSKHFLLPTIVSESMETTGGAGEKLAPISASNRVNFEVQAVYNPAAATDRKAHKTPDEKKPSADGEHADHNTPPAASGPKPPSTGPGQQTHHAIPKPHLNPGGPR
jgi:type IV pilus assembly protein PilN